MPEQAKQQQLRTKTCVLGATGTIGLELVTSLLRRSEGVTAFVRNEEKLRKLLTERDIDLGTAPLTIVEADLFTDAALTDSNAVETLSRADFVFNCATPSISKVPFSRVNRKWGSPVSDLTRKLVEIGTAAASSAGSGPHILVLCGPELFKEFDGEVGIAREGLSRVLRGAIGAFQDNHDEAMFLLQGEYANWTVLRCGEIRPGHGEVGDPGRVATDPHKDKSNYRAGKGFSLIGPDLSELLATWVHTREMDRYKKEMPFFFNTAF